MHIYGLAHYRSTWESKLITVAVYPLLRIIASIKYCIIVIGYTDKVVFWCHNHSVNFFSSGILYFTQEELFVIPLYRVNLFIASSSSTTAIPSNYYAIKHCLCMFWNKEYANS